MICIYIYMTIPFVLLLAKTVLCNHIPVLLLLYCRLGMALDHFLPWLVVSVDLQLPLTSAFLATKPTSFSTQTVLSLVQGSHCSIRRLIVSAFSRNKMISLLSLSNKFWPRTMKQAPYVCMCHCLFVRVCVCVHASSKFWICYFSLIYELILHRIFTKIIHWK